MGQDFQPEHKQLEGVIFTAAIWLDRFQVELWRGDGRRMTAPADPPFRCAACSVASGVVRAKWIDVCGLQTQTGRMRVYLRDYSRSRCSEADGTGTRMSPPGLAAICRRK